MLNSRNKTVRDPNSMSILKTIFSKMKKNRVHHYQIKNQHLSELMNGNNKLSMD